MARKGLRRSRVVSLDVPVTVLGIDANFEPITQAGFQYRQTNVYPYFQAKGFTPQLCQGSMARRVYVAPAARQAGVVYITGIGHGTPDTFTGDYYDAVFSVGNYAPEESQGKIIHLLSCQTALKLGPDFVLHGCKAFFGYDVDFTFFMDIANMFFQCDSEVDRAFADGLTAADVYTRVINLFNQNIAALRAQGSNYKAAAMESNRDHLRAPASGSQWGDPGASLG
jgi:hypothetical protein